MLDLFSPEMRPEPFDAPAMPVIRDESGKKAAMLARLKAGPLSTFEAERFSHRGQATIHALTKEGHDIQLEYIDGIPCYVHYGCAPKVKVTKTLQERYYATAHWRATAKARKELDGWKCRQCGESNELHTHHWRYNLFAESVEFDLITLCRRCHELIHDAISGSKVHFPNFVTEGVKAKIDLSEGEIEEVDSPPVSG